VNLLLIGGGHAMLPALQDAARWTENGVRVTLIDSNAHLYYSGMVPEYLGGVYPRDAVRIDLKRLCDDAGVHFVEGRAEHLDPERRRITTEDGRSFSYDVAAVDVGARNPGYLSDAVRTKPLYHVDALANQIQSVLDGRTERLRLVIAGGGAAGIEVALNVAGRFAAHNALDALSLTLVEGADRLLPDFPAGMSKYVTDRLHAAGADVICGTRVQAIADGAARLGTDRSLPADVVLWATGSIGPALFEDAGLVRDENGFARVSESLQCMGHPRLFAAGDCATVAGHESLRKVGVHAVKQGPILRTNLDRALSALRAGQPSHAWSLDTFEPYPVAPLILSTGTPTGMWTAGSLWLRGRPLLRLKHLVDRRWMRAFNPYWQHTGLLEWIDAGAAASETVSARSG